MVLASSAAVLAPAPAAPGGSEGDFRQVLAPIYLRGEKVVETAQRLAIRPGSDRLVTAYFANEVSVQDAPICVWRHLG